MFFAKELQISEVYVSQHAVGLFMPSETVIRGRKIALCGEDVTFRFAKASLRRQVGLSHGQCLLVMSCFG